MAPRNRNQTLTTHKGRIVTGGNLVLGGWSGLWHAINTCSDITGSGDCAPFSVYKLSAEGGRVNVFNSPGNYWEDFRVDYMDNTSNFVHLSPGLGQDRSDVDYATEAVSRTNPSRPYVDIPRNILELGDIARSIRRIGHGVFDTGAKANASAYLRYQFGIAPLVGDLVKLTAFQDQVARRLLEIDRLKGAKGLRRTVPVGSWSTTSRAWHVMQSNQAFFGCFVGKTTTQNVRAHTRWLPDADLSSMSISDRQRLALRSVLGLTFDSSTVWEVIPWSWLIDWCSSVGQFMAAQRNIIPATLSGVHIMRETVTEYRSDPIVFGGGTMSPVQVTVRTKTRAPSYVAPVAHFPFLSAGQMGILGSLAVTRL